jgi:sugar/nucleoside kinase (ribokinase family)
VALVIAMPESARQLDAVVAGYLGVDLAPAFAEGAGDTSLARLLRPGRLVEVGPLTLSLGGVVANTGLALSRFGRRVALMGRVGEDPLGDVALSLLGRHEATLAVTRCAEPTAYGIVLAPPDSDRVFLECPGGNATFTAADVDLSLVAQARLFHFGYPPLMPALLADHGAELVALLSRVRALGVTTSLDMTLPDPDGAASDVNWPDLLARVLPHVDLFTPSLEELLYTLSPVDYGRLMAQAGDTDPVDAIPREECERLALDALTLGARVVLVKAGHRGGYLRTGSCEGVAALGEAAPAWSDQAHWLPAAPVERRRVCNASGAGDAAVAGFLAALLSGDGPRRAGSLAMLAGRDSLYGPDTLAGLRSWEDMLADLPPAT